MKSYYNPSKTIDTNSFSELWEEKEWCCAFKAKLIAENKEVPKELEQHINCLSADINLLKK